MSKKLLLFILCLIIRLLLGALLAEAQCNDQEGVSYDVSGDKFHVDNIYARGVIEIHNPGQTKPCLSVLSSVYGNHVTGDSIYLTANEIQLMCDNRDTCPDTCKASRLDGDSEDVKDARYFVHGDAECHRAADKDYVIRCMTFTT